MTFRPAQRSRVLLALIAFLAMPSANPQKGGLMQPAAIATHAHVLNTFRFEIAAPKARVAPLFAPEAERTWAGEDWNPIFLHPQPGRDTQGAVWKIQHGATGSIWVNTLFDVPGGRMQYVAVVGDRFAMTVDVHVAALDELHTAVEVTYARTALIIEANQQVIDLGNRDRESGPDWQHSLESALGLASK